MFPGGPDDVPAMSWMAWLGRAPDPAMERLLSVFSAAHQRATLLNENASVVALRLHASVGGSFSQSLASCIATFGDKHGPAAFARRVLYRMDDDELRSIAESGAIVPGWGNSFHKHSIDPAFAEMAHLVRSEYPEHERRIQRVGDAILKGTGKVIYPNPATYTAVCSELLGLPEGTELMLAFAARMPAWAAAWVEQTMAIR